VLTKDAARSAGLPSGVEHQVVGVDGADAGGEIPAGGGAVGLEVRGVAGGEHAVGARWAVAIVGAGAIHVHVALGDVIEGAGSADGVAVAGIAGGAATRAIFGGGNLVINGIGITLAPGFLIHERLDAGHDR